MPIKINKKFVFVSAALIILIGITATAALIWPRQTFSEDKEAPVDPHKFLEENTGKDFNDLKEAYHKSMNKIFNEGFSKITAETDKTPRANTKPPENCTATTEDGKTVPNSCKECEADQDPLNVSTYCIAYRASYLYTNYMVLLDDVKVAAIQDNGGTEMADATLLLNMRFKAVEKEKTDAKTALDTTLSAYNQFRYAYPMHKAYVKTLKLLVKYRDILGKIRAQISAFPIKFISASTAKCE